MGQVVQFSGRKDSYTNIPQKVVQTKGPYIVVSVNRDNSRADLSTVDGAQIHSINGNVHLFRNITATCGLPMKTCAHCGKSTFILKDVVVHGETEGWCGSCCDAESAECVDCSTRFPIVEMCRLGDDRYACQEHRDNFVVCSECGELLNRRTAIHRGDNWFCSDCARIVHDYAYKPEPIFIGSGNRFYGMELEMENRTGEIESWLLDKSNDERVYYLKHDGSLHDGFEVVTHPHSIAAFIAAKPFWEEISAYVTKKGMRSHETERCGLHFHVSRKGLGSNETQRLRTIERVIYLYEKYFREFLLLSRRTESQLEEWARRYLDECGDVTMPRVTSAIRGNNRDKYRAINLRPSETIEFRIFRGTLKVDTLLASAQLIDNWINVAMGDKDISTITMQDIITSTEYPELMAYAKEKGVLTECVSSL